MDVPVPDCATARIDCVTIDSADPTRLVDFWGTLLGYVRLENFTASIRIGPSDGRGPVLLFTPQQPAPTSKNRLHFDLRPHDREAWTGLSRSARPEPSGVRRSNHGQCLRTRRATNSAFCSRSVTTPPSQLADEAKPPSPRRMTDAQPARLALKRSIISVRRFVSSGSTKYADVRTFMNGSAGFVALHSRGCSRGSAAPPQGRRSDAPRSAVDVADEHKVS